MRIEAVKVDGLFQEYAVSIPAALINSKVEGVIAKEAETFKMAGFREGKVPLSIVKRQIGQEVLQKQLRHTIDEAVKATIEKSQSRPAMPPEVIMEEFKEDEGMKLTIKFDALPPIPAIALENIKIESGEIEINESDIEKARNELLKRFKDFKPSDSGHKAELGDAVVIDFVGKINDVAFEGGKGSEVQLELGSSTFIPGFEDQLVGVTAGEERSITVKFPDSYPKYADQEAVFDVRVKSVLQVKVTDGWDDAFASRLGLENIDKLNELVYNRMSGDFAMMTRFQIKKDIFDLLDKEYNFELPQKMLEADLDHLVKEASSKKTVKPTEQEEADMRLEFATIAHRRVKLGLMLAELARANNVTVTENDIKETISAQAAQMPGKEKELVDHYSKLENLKMLEGPILEEKTIDFILSKISLNITKMTAEEFGKKYKDL